MDEAARQNLIEALRHDNPIAQNIRDQMSNRFPYPLDQPPTPARAPLPSQLSTSVARALNSVLIPAQTEMWQHERNGHEIGNTAARADEVTSETTLSPPQTEEQTRAQLSHLPSPYGFVQPSYQSPIQSPIQPLYQTPRHLLPQTPSQQLPQGYYQRPHRTSTQSSYPVSRQQQHEPSQQRLFYSPLPSQPHPHHNSLPPLLGAVPRGQAQPNGPSGQYLQTQSQSRNHLHYQNRLVTPRQPALPPLLPYLHSSLYPSSHLTPQNHPHPTPQNHPLQTPQAHPVHAPQNDAHPASPQNLSPPSQASSSQSHEHPHPRLLFPELSPTTYIFPPLRARTASEARHPKQKAFLEKVQQLPLTRLHPHEFLDHLTVYHNDAFKPPVARVYDVLFMQALLFRQDKVLLVSPKDQDTKWWEPAQSVWHAYDLPHTSGHAVETHVKTALNRVTGLQPHELVPCAPGRVDAATHVVKQNGDLVYGWSVTLCFEVRLGVRFEKPPDFAPCLEREMHDRQQVRCANMDPVVKGRVLGALANYMEVERQLLEFGRTDPYFNGQYSRLMARGRRV